MGWCQVYEKFLLVPRGCPGLLQMENVYQGGSGLTQVYLKKLLKSVLFCLPAHRIILNCQEMCSF